MDGHQTIRIHTYHCRRKNLTRAADRLFLTQSALSQQLSKLEAEGLPPLFTRHKGEMQLTDAGKIYINGARSILKIKGDAQEALKDLSQAKSTTSTSVSAGCFSLYTMSGSCLG